MEWVVEGERGPGVPVADALAHPLGDALDVPRGFLPLDPHRDTRILPERVSGVRERLRSAAEERREEHRREVLRRLRLERWEPWAEGALRSARERDPLLSLLEELEALCAHAAAAGRGVLVLGD